MHVKRFLLLLTWVIGCSEASTTGVPASTKPVRNIAIIGAGAAGSSTAYHLHKFAAEEGVNVNITIFEKTDRIGGRTLTINPYGDPAKRVELGASIFVEVNAILYNATRDFGLQPTYRQEKLPDSGSSADEDDADEILAFWDGEQVRFSINENHSSWRTSARLIWRYGYFALTNSQKLMHKTIAKFLKLYTPPYFPFKSLTERVLELELLEETSVTGEEFLRKNKIPDLLSHEFIQALTRVNYASNLAHIHGLETMVATAPEGAMAVHGGNWQIFDHFVRLSGARILQNTSVASLSTDSKESASSRPKYILETVSTTEVNANKHTQLIAFDDVVIATPYQYSKISAGEGIFDTPIDEIPYIKLHVTIFASPLRLSAAYFKVSPSQRPTTVLTTLPEGDDPTSGVQGAGKAGFYSISTLRTITNPKTGGTEYLYKIFSPEKVTADFLSNIFGVEIPETFIGSTSQTNAVEPISWYYPHVFNSYPKAFPRVTFQEPVIRDGLYYTSGMESFISTMETNALMGMNVARLIVDDILAGTESVGFTGGKGGDVQGVLLQEEL